MIFFTYPALSSASFCWSWWESGVRGAFGEMLAAWYRLWYSCCPGNASVDVLYWEYPIQSVALIERSTPTLPSENCGQVQRSGRSAEIHSWAARPTASMRAGLVRRAGRPR